MSDQLPNASTLSDPFNSAQAVAIAPQMRASNLIAPGNLPAATPTDSFRNDASPADSPSNFFDETQKVLIKSLALGGAPKAAVVHVLRKEIKPQDVNAWEAAAAPEVKAVIQKLADDKEVDRTKQLRSVRAFFADEMTRTKVRSAADAMTVLEARPNIFGREIDSAKKPILIARQETEKQAKKDAVEWYTRTHNIQAVDNVEPDVAVREHNAAHPGEAPRAAAQLEQFKGLDNLEQCLYNLQRNKSLPSPARGHKTLLANW